jgi:hypothetical protein
MIKIYEIWPKEVIPCIDKCMGTITFKIMVGKKNVEKIVNQPLKIKKTIMMVNDCSENCCHKYEVHRCTACFNDSDMRHAIAFRISANTQIVSIMPVLTMTRSGHKFH